MAGSNVIVVGAGAGGLAAAIDLARGGCNVHVLERGAEPGGKMRPYEVGGSLIDAGPTVLTMRWVFEDLFEGSLPLHLEPAHVLARHAWPDGTRFDLASDPEATRENIARTFGDENARGWDSFREESERLWSALRATFIESERPSVWKLARSAKGLGTIPLRTMWGALERHFADPRLRQLFGRYATYCGSSPFHAPATLQVIAHVEMLGVHRVRGGMRALAAAMTDLARKHGVRFSFERDVVQIRTSGERVRVVMRDDALEADAVVFAGDASALGDLLGMHASKQPRSLSAVTFAMQARADRFPLVHHNVFFSDDYPSEMRALARGTMPEAPTVYACAQDRGDDDLDLASERMLLVVNAPATGDEPERWNRAEAERWKEVTFRSMERCGLTVTPRAIVQTSPADFHRAYPSTGGAIYGPITHGMFSAFRRYGSRAPIPRLYLAGGSVHPGAGVPMATLSGRLAARSLLADLAWTRAPRAIAGTTSMA